LALVPFEERTALFVFGLALIGSTERSENVSIKATRAERALSLGSETTIIELPSYP
jgi:hypothetical protein